MENKKIIDRKTAFQPKTEEEISAAQNQAEEAKLLAEETRSRGQACLNHELFKEYRDSLLKYWNILFSEIINIEYETPEQLVVKFEKIRQKAISYGALLQSVTIDANRPIPGGK